MTPITFALCSNRINHIPAALSELAAVVHDYDKIIVIVDVHVEPTVLHDLATATRLRRPQLTMLANGANRGLAYSRNLAITMSEDDLVFFVDDDVRLSPDAIAAVRTRGHSGSAVIGGRILPDFQGERVPWHLTEGQWHYVGCHSPAGRFAVWGGFLVVNVPAVRRLAVRFDENLGRMGSTLLSGEDSSFVRAVTAAGGRIEALPEVWVTHKVPPERTRLRYLLRRAFWQGRTERRRRCAWRGLLKEWRRNWQTASRLAIRLTLAPMYGFSVLAGVIWETVVEFLTSRPWQRATVRKGYEG